jgi:hypothetical protein
LEEPAARDRAGLEELEESAARGRAGAQEPAAGLAQVRGVGRAAEAARVAVAREPVPAGAWELAPAGAAVLVVRAPVGLGQAVVGLAAPVDSAGVAPAEAGLAEDLAEEGKRNSLGGGRLLPHSFAKLVCWVPWEGLAADLGLASKAASA